MATNIRCDKCKCVFDTPDNRLQHEEIFHNKFVFDDKEIGVLQINAGIIAGALIFLSLSNVGVILSSFFTAEQMDVALIYRGITTLIGIGFIGPFALSAVCILLLRKYNEYRLWAKTWMWVGFLMIPGLAAILAIIYFLAGFGIIGYIPPPPPPTST